MVWLRRSDSPITCDSRWRCTAISAKKKARDGAERDDADHREELRRRAAGATGSRSRGRRASSARWRGRAARARACPRRPAPACARARPRAARSRPVRLRPGHPPPFRKTPAREPRDSDTPRQVRSLVAHQHRASLRAMVGTRLRSIAAGIDDRRRRRSAYPCGVPRAARVPARASRCMSAPESCRAWRCSGRMRPTHRPVAPWGGLRTFAPFAPVLRAPSPLHASEPP